LFQTDLVLWLHQIILFEVGGGEVDVKLVGLGLCSFVCIDEKFLQKEKSYQNGKEWLVPQEVINKLNPVKQLHQHLMSIVSVSTRIEE